MRKLIALALGFAAALPAYRAGCEDPPGVRQPSQSAPAFRDLPRVERHAKVNAALEALIAEHPREVAIHRWYSIHLGITDPEKLPSVAKRYADADPPDAVSETLAGLYGRDPRRYERAKQLDPELPWPYLWLANAYRSSDRKKAHENLIGYLELCLGSTNPMAYSLVHDLGSKDEQLQAFDELRTRLESEADPERLLFFGTLWAHELRLGLDARKTILSDVHRLEESSGVNAALLQLIATGLRNARALPRRALAVEDRLLREFPSSGEALTIRRTRWYDEQFRKPDRRIHPQAAVDAHHQWLRDFPHFRWLLLGMITHLRALPSIRPEEAAATVRDALAHVEDWMGGTSSAAVYYRYAAEIYLKAGLPPKQAQAWLAHAAELNAPGNDIDRLEIVRLQLKALRIAPDPASLAALRPALAADPNEKRQLHQSMAYANLARLAEIDGKLDTARALYRKAVEMRGRYAVLEDSLLEDMGRVFGGEEAAWRTWIPVPPRPEPERPAWQPVDLDLPPFELTDLTGKIWTSQSLKGKAVMINVWASWCGPCREELPRVQQLWELTQFRSDVIVITLTIDELMSTAAAHVKSRNYSFPVLWAPDYFAQLAADKAVPQTWIISAGGKWKWKQRGYDWLNANWAWSALSKMEEVRE